MQCLNLKISGLLHVALVPGVACELEDHLEYSALVDMHMHRFEPGPAEGRMIGIPALSKHFGSMQHHAMPSHVPRTANA